MSFKTVCYVAVGLLAVTFFRSDVENTVSASQPAEFGTAEYHSCPNCGTEFTETAYTASEAPTTKPEQATSVSGGFKSGYRSYGGPVRKFRAWRLSRIENRGGFRSCSAGRRLGRMNCRY